jgi:pSer/pThr/pTyr-binding forkhead associated (FHA) protein
LTVQLTLLSGARAGETFPAARFPFTIGRERSAALPLEAPGVWERHLQLQLQPGEGIFISVNPATFVLVNGQPLQHGLLRNGDRLEVGGARLQFALGETRPRDWRLRVGLTWLAVLALTALQFCLVYAWLP